MQLTQVRQRVSGDGVATLLRVLIDSAPSSFKARSARLSAVQTCHFLRLGIEVDQCSLLGLFAWALCLGSLLGNFGSFLIGTHVLTVGDAA
jgi:hypothetical protein